MCSDTLPPHSVHWSCKNQNALTIQFGMLIVISISAGRGTRTHTTITNRQLLRLMRLPFRHSSLLILVSYNFVLT